MSEKQEYSIYHGIPVNIKDNNIDSIIDLNNMLGTYNDINECIDKNKTTNTIVGGLYNSEDSFNCFGSTDTPNEYSYIYAPKLNTKLQPIRSASKVLSEDDKNSIQTGCTNGANITNLCKHGDNSKLYINPLGQVKNIVAGDNIRDNINKSITRKSQLDNSNEKIKIAESQLIIWSVVLGITSLVFLGLLKNIKK